MALPGHAWNIIAWNCAFIAVAGRSALSSIPSLRHKRMSSVLFDSPTASPKVTEAMLSRLISACVGAFLSWYPLNEGHILSSVDHSPDFWVLVELEINVSCAHMRQPVHSHKMLRAIRQQSR